MALRASGQLTRAIAALEMAVKLDLNALAFNNRGDVWFEMVKFDQAIKDYLGQPYSHPFLILY